jgi:hypothetical protein
LTASTTWRHRNKSNQRLIGKIQTIKRKEKRKKERLKVWKAYVVWLDNDITLGDISKYLNLGNKKRAYQTSWIRNIMAYQKVWEVYVKPTWEREDAKYKNPKVRGEYFFN